MSLVNTEVKPYTTQAFHNGKFVEVSNESLKGKWSVLIFMPAAFTFNCPTEIEDAANSYAEFQKAGAEVYAVTTDRSEEHTSELQSLMRISYAVFCLKKKTNELPTVSKNNDIHQPHIIK